MPTLDYSAIIRRGRGAFSPAAYMVAVCRKDRWNRPYIYHVETFYGHDGRMVRAKAARYAKALNAKGIGRMRLCHIPSGFSSKGLPPLESEVRAPLETLS